MQLTRYMLRRNTASVMILYRLVGCNLPSKLVKPLYALQ